MTTPSPKNKGENDQQFRTNRSPTNVPIRSTLTSPFIYVRSPLPEFMQNNVYELPTQCHNFGTTKEERQDLAKLLRPASLAAIRNPLGFQSPAYDALHDKQRKLTTRTRSNIAVRASRSARNGVSIPPVYQNPEFRNFYFYLQTSKVNRQEPTPPASMLSTKPLVRLQNRSFGYGHESSEECVENKHPVANTSKLLRSLKLPPKFKERSFSAQVEARRHSLKTASSEKVSGETLASVYPLQYRHNPKESARHGPEQSVIPHSWRTKEEKRNLFGVQYTNDRKLFDGLDNRVNNEVANNNKSVIHEDVVSRSKECAFDKLEKDSMNNRDVINPLQKQAFRLLNRSREATNTLSDRHAVKKVTEFRNAQIERSNQPLFWTSYIQPESYLKLYGNVYEIVNQDILLTDPPASNASGALNVTEERTTSRYNVPAKVTPKQACNPPKQLEFDSGNASDEEVGKNLSKFVDTPQVTIPNNDKERTTSAAVPEHGECSSDNEAGPSNNDGSWVSVNDESVDDAQSAEEAVRKNAVNVHEADEFLGDLPIPTDMHPGQNHKTLDKPKQGVSEQNFSVQGDNQRQLVGGSPVKVDSEEPRTETTGCASPSSATKIEKLIQTAVPTGDHPTGKNDEDPDHTSSPAVQTLSDEKQTQEESVRDVLSHQDLRSPCVSMGDPVRQQRKKTGHRVCTKNERTVHPALINSLFPNVPPVLKFVEDGCKLESLPWDFRRLLRWRASVLTPVVVKQVLMRSGFRVSKLTSATEDLDTIESSDWIFYFGKHMRPQVFRSIREYQKVNHLPCSFHLGRKDRLWKNLVHMQAKFGKENFSFMPETFCLPGDLEALKKVWDEEGDNQRWILKPPAAARGIGVRLITKWAQVPKKRPAIVQKYLARPFLINESKFDLRIYVFISSVNPLRVYIHEDGLVRFASQKYTNATRCLGNRFIHLTNYSINRLNSEYVSNSSDLAAKGHKWSLRALWVYFRSQGIAPAPVWSSIKDLVVKTAISTETAFNTAMHSYCNHSYSVNEVFGFDIFLDEDLKPWLLEVNVSPSMHSDSPLDAKIKGNMVKDMLNIAGLRIPEPSDTNSHTVMPTCIVKPTTTKQSEVNCTVEMNPVWQCDPTGTSITPIHTPPESHFNLNEETCTAELQQKNNGDGENPKKPKPPTHEWIIDQRLYMQQLNHDEREKRRYYVNRAVQYELPRTNSANVSAMSGNLAGNRGSCRRISARTKSSCSKSFVTPLEDDNEDCGSTTTETSSESESFSSCDECSRRRTVPSAVSTNFENNISRTARSMGIGPSSPDLRSHRGPPAKEVPFPRPPLAPREKAVSKTTTNQSASGTTSNSVSNRTHQRSVSASPFSSSQAPTRCQSVLPRVRLASATCDILQTLTPSDVRILIEMVDELERAGGFECIFPPSSAGLAVRYLSYFEFPRYANLLCVAYLQKFAQDKEEGIELLRKCCEKKLHIKSAAHGDFIPKENIWESNKQKHIVAAKDVSRSPVLKYHRREPSSSNVSSSS
ncbi:Tubulin polyglutamylase ttll4 [Clonorchis sinensis]|uniref:Tubulin polyglutamylase ttll4 n=1 Tax=Clonorchis sinensis TaxID=79923 RepID=A0A8T1MB37_CLOSI|nr:Tubulin polyglutamylase ttll4 [Clonorchis sinensis]